MSDKEYVGERMKCPKCGLDVQYFIPFSDGVFLSADGGLHIFKDNSLVEWISIECSSENCDWHETRDLSDELREAIAWEVGLLKDCPKASIELLKSLTSLHKRN